jgi:hypothetical protein
MQAIFDLKGITDSEKMYRDVWLIPWPGPKVLDFDQKQGEACVFGTASPVEVMPVSRHNVVWVCGYTGSALTSALMTQINLAC